MASIVGQMVVARRVSIQRRLATSGYKRILTFQMVRSRAVRPVPEARFTELYALRRPPTDVRPWLGATQGGSAVYETSTKVDLTTTSTSTPGFFSAVALGNLLLLCAGRALPGPEPVTVGGRADRRALV